MGAIHRPRRSAPNVCEFLVRSFTNSGWLACMILLLAVLVPERAHAQSGTYWLPQSGNFSDNSNWSAGSPYFYQNAYIDNGGTAIADQTGADAHSLYLGDSNGSGTITQSAGTASIFLLGLGFGGNGTYNLNGGVLSVAEVENGSGAAFNFGGGVFQCNYSPYDNISANMPVNLTGGSATVDVENYASVNFSGNFSGSGSLTKIGSGILDLSGSVNYTGNVQINSGWLNLSAGRRSRQSVNMWATAAWPPSRNPTGSTRLAICSWA